MSLMMDMTGCVLLFSEMAPFEMTMSTSRILSVLFDDETLEEVPNVPGVSASVNMCICAQLSDNSYPAVLQWLPGVSEPSLPICSYVNSQQHCLSSRKSFQLVVEHIASTPDAIIL